MHNSLVARQGSVNPKNYNQRMIASLPPIFHITCNLAKLSLQTLVLCKFYNYSSVLF
jgi:hypothetical protein